MTNYNHVTNYVAIIYQNSLLIKRIQTNKDQEIRRHDADFLSYIYTLQ